MITSNIYNNFTCFNSNYKHIKYYTKLGTYIPPQEYTIGERLNENRNKNTFIIIPVNCTEQFIPIQKVFKKFFELKNVLIDTLDYMNKVKIFETISFNFIQGSIWQKKLKDYEDDQIVLPIFYFLTTMK